MSLSTSIMARIAGVQRWAAPRITPFVKAGPTLAGSPFCLRRNPALNFRAGEIVMGGMPTKHPSTPNLETLEKLAGALEIELYQLFFVGEGKPHGASQKEAATLGSGERGLVESFTSLDKKDRKFVVAMARKMAKERRAAKRSS